MSKTLNDIVNDENLNKYFIYEHYKNHQILNNGIRLKNNDNEYIDSYIDEIFITNYVVYFLNNKNILKNDDLNKYIKNSIGNALKSKYLKDNFKIVNTYDELYFEINKSINQYEEYKQYTKKIEEEKNSFLSKILNSISKFLNFFKNENTYYTKPIIESINALKKINFTTYHINNKENNSNNLNNNIFKEYEVLYLFGYKNFFDSENTSYQFLLSLENVDFNFIINVFDSNLKIDSNNQNHKKIKTERNENLINDIKYKLVEKTNSTKKKYELVINQIYLKDIQTNETKVITLENLKDKYDFIKQLKNKQNNKLFISNNDYEFDKNTGNYILDNMN